MLANDFQPIGANVKDRRANWGQHERLWMDQSHWKDQDKVWVDVIAQRSMWSTVTWQGSMPNAPESSTEVLEELTIYKFVHELHSTLLHTRNDRK